MISYHNVPGIPASNCKSLQTANNRVTRKRNFFDIAAPLKETTTSFRGCFRTPSKAETYLARRFYNLTGIAKFANLASSISSASNAGAEHPAHFVRARRYAIASTGKSGQLIKPCSRSKVTARLEIER
jgi:hypothetical protein